MRPRASVVAAAAAANDAASGAPQRSRSAKRIPKPPPKLPFSTSWRIVLLTVVGLIVAALIRSYLPDSKPGLTSPASNEHASSRGGDHAAGFDSNDVSEDDLEDESPGSTGMRKISAETVSERVMSVLQYGFEEIRTGRRAGKKLKRDFDNEAARRVIERFAGEFGGGRTGGNAAVGTGTGAAGDDSMMDTVMSIDDERWETRRKREVKDRYDWVYSQALKKQGISRGTKYSSSSGVQVGPLDFAGWDRI